jgi:hypothetical protein
MTKTYDHHDAEDINFRTGVRRLRAQAHLYFDKLWQLGYIERREAYDWLSKRLGLPEPKAHMRFMDEDQCREVIRVCVQQLNDLRRLDLDFGDPIKHPYYYLLS